MQLVSNEQLAQWFPGENESDLTLARDAAERYVGNVCRIPADLEQVPADLVQAVRLLVARWLARRNSPDGTLGMSEFGVGRISTVDRDVLQLIAPYRRVVFG